MHIHRGECERQKREGGRDLQLGTGRTVEEACKGQISTSHRHRAHIVDGQVEGGRHVRGGSPALDGARHQHGALVDESSSAAAGHQNGACREEEDEEGIVFSVAHERIQEEENIREGEKKGKEKKNKER